MYIKKEIEKQIKQNFYKNFEELLYCFNLNRNNKILFKRYLKLKSFFYINYNNENILKFYFTAFSILFDLLKYDLYKDKLKYKLIINIFKKIIFFNYSSIIDLLFLFILPMYPDIYEYNLRGIFKNIYKSRTVFSRIYRILLNIKKKEYKIYLTPLKILFKTFQRIVLKLKLENSKNIYNENYIFFVYFLNFLDSFIDKDMRMSFYDIKDFKDLKFYEKSEIDLKYEFEIQNFLFQMTLNNFLNNEIYKKNNNCELFNFKLFNLPKYLSNFKPKIYKRRKKKKTKNFINFFYSLTFNIDKYKYVYNKKNQNINSFYNFLKLHKNHNFNFISFFNYNFYNKEYDTLFEKVDNEYLEEDFHFVKLSYKTNITCPKEFGYFENINENYLKNFECIQLSNDFNEYYNNLEESSENDTEDDTEFDILQLFEEHKKKEEQRYRKVKLDFDITSIDSSDIKSELNLQVLNFF